MRIKDDHLYLPTGDGQFISEKQRRISEILIAYYQYLELQWIPPNERGPDEYAFRVLDTTPGRRPSIVTFSKECDERLLAQVIRADNTNGNVMSIMDAHNASVELYNHKKNQEELAERHEFAYSVLRNKKIHYRHNGIDYGAHNGGRDK